MPGFLNNIEEVRAKGYEVVVCTTVNDAFVTGAWAKDLKSEDKIRILADPNAQLAKVDTYFRNN